MKTPTKHPPDQPQLNTEGTELIAVSCSRGGGTGSFVRDSKTLHKDGGAHPTQNYLTRRPSKNGTALEEPPQPRAQRPHNSLLSSPNKKKSKGELEPKPKPCSKSLEQNATSRYAVHTHTLSDFCDIDLMVQQASGRRKKPGKQSFKLPHSHFSSLSSSRLKNFGTKSSNNNYYNLDNHPHHQESLCLSHMEFPTLEESTTLSPLHGRVVFESVSRLSSIASSPQTSKEQLSQTADLFIPEPQPLPVPCADSPTNLVSQPSSCITDRGSCSKTPQKQCQAKAIATSVTGCPGKSLQTLQQSESDFSANNMSTGALSKRHAGAANGSCQTNHTRRNHNTSASAHSHPNKNKFKKNICNTPKYRQKTAPTAYNVQYQQGHFKSRQNNIDNSSSKSLNNNIVNSVLKKNVNNPNNNNNSTKYYSRAEEPSETQTTQPFEQGLWSTDNQNKQNWSHEATPNGMSPLGGIPSPALYPLATGPTETAGLPLFPEILPSDILFEIFSHLPPESLAKLAIVSKQWKCISENQSLWKDKAMCAHYEKARDNNRNDDSLYQKESMNWKLVYKDLKRNNLFVQKSVGYHTSIHQRPTEYIPRPFNTKAHSAQHFSNYLLGCPVTIERVSSLRYFGIQVCGTNLKSDTNVVMGLYSNDTTSNLPKTLICETASAPAPVLRPGEFELAPSDFRVAKGGHKKSPSSPSLASSPSSHSLPSSSSLSSLPLSSSYSLPSSPLLPSLPLSSSHSLPPSSLPSSLSASLSSPSSSPPSSSPPWSPSLKGEIAGFRLVRGTQNSNEEELQREGVNLQPGVYWLMAIFSKDVQVIQSFQNFFTKICYFSLHFPKNGGKSHWLPRSLAGQEISTYQGAPSNFYLVLN